MHQGVVALLNTETNRKRLLLAIAGKDCAIMLVLCCWENLSIRVNSVTIALKVWLLVIWVFF